MNELQSQITLAIALSYALQWLKGKLDSTGFPLGFNNPKFNAFAAGIFAFLASLGIAFHFDYSAHELIISGLSWAGVQSGLVHFIQQYLYQHAAYKTLIAPPLPGAEQAQKRDAAAVGTVPPLKPSV